MKHSIKEKQLRKQFLKAKRRLKLGVAKDGDVKTVIDLYTKPHLRAR